MATARDNDFDLPCPLLTLAVDVSSDADANEAALIALPAKPGILVIEDESAATLSLLQTADLRRAARVRLGAIDPEQAAVRSRRADLRPIARRVLATTVGSSFESDWACLQLARIRLPHSYRSMLDRWQAWFVHCDPDEQFPEWVKTGHPTSSGGVHIGPFADKHAAARFREMLEDAFDLCRFHHILVQAPHGSACAYKEMGRCPAPCDGSVSMQHYHDQIRASIDFAKQPATARQDRDTQMRERSATMDFESAAAARTMLERTVMSERSEFAQVRDFEDFRFLAALPAERNGLARLFAIVGGWIAPLADVHEAADAATLRDMIERAANIAPDSPGRSAAEIENIGLVCRHLLLPKAQAKRRRVEFLHWDDQQPTSATLTKVIVRVLRVEDAQPDPATPKPAPESELEITP